jgi:hypothetical protein
MEGQQSALAASPQKKPWAVEFRSSVGFCTAVVFLSLFCDLLVYSVIIPSKLSILPRRCGWGSLTQYSLLEVIPFRLQQLGNDPATSSSLTGWLLVVYVSTVVGICNQFCCSDP